MVPLLTLDKLRRVLFVGAHCDDIEIGCGATILRMLEANHGLEVHWVVLSSDARRAGEARQSADRFLAGAAKKDVRICEFPNAYFPFQADKIKDYFETLKPIAPDLVFTHFREDRHQDHRVVSDLSWNTFRNHAILEYEIPKYDGDLGKPNVFLPADRRHATRKAEIVFSAFESQHQADWFDPELFLALMRIRGMECHAPSGLAEAFYGRKLVV
jgi:LmbE family N-acetylglucosaminyl deacetylase